MKQLARFSQRWGSRIEHGGVNEGIEHQLVCQLLLEAVWMQVWKTKWEEVGSREKRVDCGEPPGFTDDALAPVMGQPNVCKVHILLANFVVLIDLGKEGAVQFMQPGAAVHNSALHFLSSLVSAENRELAVLTWMHRLTGGHHTKRLLLLVPCCNEVKGPTLSGFHCCHLAVLTCFPVYLLAELTKRKVLATLALHIHHREQATQP